MSEKLHPVHQRVSHIFRESLPPQYSLVRDKACGGDQRIPLFYSTQKSLETEYCNVDLLVLKKNKIKMIVEIEESDVKPTQVCGKFLTSALAKYYIHDSKLNKPVEMDESVTFIQIVATSKLAEHRTAKYKQWKALEESITAIIPTKNSKITTYKLLTTDELDRLPQIVKEAI